MGRSDDNGEDDKGPRQVLTTTSCANSENAPKFKSVKPRIGNQYQARVSKFVPNETLARRAPVESMSKDWPFLTEEEAYGGPTMRLERIQQDVDEEAVVNVVENTGLGPLNYVRPPTQRGGLCVHRSDTSHMDDYLVTCRNVMFASSSASIRSSSNTLTEESWTQDMIRRYGKATSLRRRNKRKLPDNDDEAWGGGQPLPTRPAPKPQPLEEDGAMLEYLTVRHNGNVEAAQLAVWVGCSAGRAVKARRGRNQRLHSERFRRPPVASSQSWMQRYESTCPTVLGDLRPDPSFSAYPYVDRAEPPAADSGGYRGNSTADDDGIPWEDDMKGVWRAVLAHGQAMERELNNPGQTKMRLSEVVSFVRNAYGLPTPEESFGSRHIVVERISENLHAILDYIAKACDAQAKLTDILYDESQEGVDMDDLQKYLDELNRTCPIHLDQLDAITRQLQLAADWKARLDDILTTNDDDAMVTAEGDRLAEAENLALEGSSLGIRSRNLVLLEKRIEKAYHLRDRIGEWKKSQSEGKQQSIKFIAGLVREANRMNLSFPEVSELIAFHRSVEDWVDRANVAIRSRISLTEIVSLMERAESMRLDLSEYVDKLESRACLARAWVNAFQQIVPCPNGNGSLNDAYTKLAWMSRMREGLKSSDKNQVARLLDMASEGTRIPVEIDEVKLLLLEIDAKNWSLKAKKWIPKTTATEDGESNGGKRGKLEDLRDHLAKADNLREKLEVAPDEKGAWTLDGEAELKSILQAADDWFEKYQTYLEYDNRRTNQERSCLSIPKLRQIVDEANSIHANIGSASNKMSRILAQAEAWNEEYGDLLTRCGLCRANGTISSSANGHVTVDEMLAAVYSASSDVSLDLDEAQELKGLAERAQTWMDRVVSAVPKRSKRVGKSKLSKARYSVQDLVALIDEASGLPIQTGEPVERLMAQLATVNTWRLQAQSDLEGIAAAFCSLQHAIESTYGPPQDFFSQDAGGAENMDMCDGVGHTSPAMSDNQNKPVPIEDDAMSASEDASQTDTASTVGSEGGVTSLSRLGGGGSYVYKMISTLLTNARLTGVYTAEEETAEQLEKVAKWCVKSLRFIDSPKDVFEKRSFAPFDSFIQTGHALVNLRQDLDATMDVDSEESVRDISSSWGGLVADQLMRLESLQSHRNEFIEWCKTAQQVMSSKEKRATLDDLEGLAEQSRDFPSSADMVQKVRNLCSRAKKWTESAHVSLNASTKLTMQEAKELFEEGDKLNLAGEEIRILRHALRNARSWANRVKRSKVDQGGTQVNDVQELIDEHDAMLISMPEEVAKLKQAMQGYCICRRPYEGFMIGCDGCEEWYHGACIGISESQADRYDKFMCIRCCITRVFKASSSSIVSVIRKWTSSKELKKARQGDAQKHQRKVRKETRDIEKLSAEMETLEHELSEMRSIGMENCASSNNGLDSFLPPRSSERVDTATVSPSSLESVNQDEDSLPAQIIINSENEYNRSTNDSEQGGLQTGDDATSLEDSIQSENRGMGSLESNSKLNDGSKLTKEGEIREKIQTITNCLKGCEDRLLTLNKRSAERKEIEAKENALMNNLHTWCIRVRSLVLVPSSVERADMSRPLADGSLSAPMKNILEDANTLGVAKLPDVTLVENAFSSIAWCCYAMSILSRKPRISDINCVISQCANIQLPEEKSVRMMKSIVQRANLWQSKVGKVLAPIPGETKSLNLEVLKELVAGADDIPLHLPEKARLLITIDDKGTRHCICGGPHDGSFMLCCDKCERWFHGRCVKVDKVAGNALKNWVCPPCQGVLVHEQDLALDGADEMDEVTDSESDDDQALHAPIPEKLWPPFGLLQSADAVLALGDECCAIQDDVDSVDKGKHPETSLQNASETKYDADIPLSTIPDRSHDVAGQAVMFESVPKDIFTTLPLLARMQAELPCGNGCPGYRQTC